MYCASTIFSPVRGQTSVICSTAKLRGPAARHHFPAIRRDRRDSTTSPVRRRPCTTNSIRYRQRRRAFTGDQRTWPRQADPGHDSTGSTSEAYGDPNVHPQTEDYWGNVNPSAFARKHDEGKRCAETPFRLLQAVPPEDQGGAHIHTPTVRACTQRRSRRVELRRERVRNEPIAVYGRATRRDPSATSTT
jgi:hypothetical protein